MQHKPASAAKRRLEALRREMHASGTDLVAVGPGSHMEWLVGVRLIADERPCMLLVSRETETFVTPALNAAETRDKSTIGLHIWADGEGPDAAIASALAEVGGSRIVSVALDEAMRVDCGLLLLDALPKGTRTSLAADTVGRLRMVKDESEIAVLKASAAAADRALLAAFSAIRPGLSESELAAVVRAEFVSCGATPAFWAIASGPNGSFPHHSTGDRRLRDGDAIVIDIGARKGGYPSDITRMAFLGTPTDEYRHVHGIVEMAVRAALGAARPGVAARDVDAAARNVIAEAGYGDYFVHRTGHGLGIDIHERPFIDSSNATPLQEGNVFSIEPGIYLPGRFGVRLEEIVVLRDSGPEIFSSLGRDVRSLAA